MVIGLGGASASYNLYYYYKAEEFVYLVERGRSQERLVRIGKLFLVLDSPFIEKGYITSRYD